MPRRATEHLTDRLVRSLPAPVAGAAITYDADVAGFGIRVTANGVRSFVLNYVVYGRERRMTIGRFPTWSATAAREEARALRRKVDAKVDPLDEQEAQLHRRGTSSGAHNAAPVQPIRGCRSSEPYLGIRSRGQRPGMPICSTTRSGRGK